MAAREVDSPSSILEAVARMAATSERIMLAERIGRSVFLDDAHPLRSGSGKCKRNQSMHIRLNASRYSAPRRKSWSVVVEAECVDAD